VAAGLEQYAFHPLCKTFNSINHIFLQQHSASKAYISRIAKSSALKRDFDCGQKSLLFNM